MALKTITQLQMLLWWGLILVLPSGMVDQILVTMGRALILVSKSGMDTISFGSRSEEGLGEKRP